MTDVKQARAAFEASLKDPLNPPDPSEVEKILTDYEEALIPVLAKGVRDYVYYFGASENGRAEGWTLNGKPGKLEDWLRETIKEGRSR